MSAKKPSVWYGYQIHCHGCRSQFHRNPSARSHAAAQKMVESLARVDGWSVGEVYLCPACRRALQTDTVRGAA